MNLRDKLLLAQIPLAMSLVVASAVSRRTVGALERESQGILKDNYRSVLAVERVRDAAVLMARDALAHTRSGERMPQATLTRSRAALERELTFQEANITEAGEREMTGRLRASWAAFQRDYRRTLESAPPLAQRVYLDALQPELLVLIQASSDITTVNQDAMVRKSDQTRKIARTLGAMTVGVDVVALLLGIMASVYLTNRLTRPLSVLSQAVRRLGQGDLAVRAKLATGDEIAQVAGEFNVMAQRLAEYRASSLGELLAAQEASQAVIDSLPDPVMVLHEDGTLLNQNRAAETMFGPESGGEGDRPARLPPAVEEIVERMRRHVVTTRSPFVPKGLDEAVTVQVRDGTRHLLPRGTPVLREDGAMAGVAVVLQDVTRLRRFDELRNDLVATVAHEFRTPLTSLRMASYLLAEGTVGPLTEKQADLVSAVREDGERLQGIVDDLLDLSRIQAGRIELRSRTASSRSLIEQAVDAHHEAAAQQRIELGLNPLTIDRPVLADPDRVQLVFSNLLGNALRHTPAGGSITLRAAPHDAPVAAGFIRFEVSDTGPGIAAEHLAHLFQRFFRPPDAPPGGAGLGLYICKEIVEAHGGEIGVESDAGHGAIFWFTLRAAPAPLSS